MSLDDLLNVIDPLLTPEIDPIWRIIERKAGAAARATIKQEHKSRREEAQLHASKPLVFIPVRNVLLLVSSDIKEMVYFFYFYFFNRRVTEQQQLGRNKNIHKRSDRRGF